WHLLLPINKYLWTSSFVLLTSGAAIVTLLVLVQLEKFRAVLPIYRVFVPLGKNPLFIYVLSIVWVKTYYLFTVDGVAFYPYAFNLLSQFLSHYNASLAFALIHVAIFGLIAWWMDRKKIIITL
ncbi:MAG TPA: DUF5009 domain-containing protein, partial [Cellvibrionaceae bacterium]